MTAPFQSWGRVQRQTGKLLPLMDSVGIEVPDSCFLPVGLGRSYGDGCLNRDGDLLPTTGCDKIIHAEANPLIKGKKAVTVISQGDFSPSSSSLVFMVLDSNLRDFQLRKVGEVISTGNLHKIKVKEKKEDLQKAFEVGVRLVTAK